ncbi:PA3496 family putative envelope integrity protein [Thioalkalivibrio sp. AKL19]|uniref:PA3496 family putative envelope integrity protein n=1 Tax=Thioalkalivibrio sp. AKL19 TaxID=1266914 RepID=UPI000428FF07|nr:hypothetical protein [Thioalkalivibrio sp. AKL19]
MDPTIDDVADGADEIASLFDNQFVNDRGPARHAARRTLERLMEERALRAHLQDDFDLDPSHDALEW